MKPKLILRLVLVLLASTLLGSCGSSGGHVRGDGHSGGMSSWERSRR